MIEGYKKLINDLKMHQRFREGYQNELDYNKRLFEEAQRPNTRATINNKPLSRVIDDINYYGNLVYIEQDNIDRLEATLKAIDECMNEGDIVVRVAHLRALGMSQESVAELVDRSPRQVQRIEAKINEKFENIMTH